MAKFRKSLVLLGLVCGAALALRYCAPEKPELIKVAQISDNEYDPEVWGRVYPLNYESWRQTKHPKPAGKSRYRRGWDEDRIIYDRLSEFPFSALLYHGWGFGIEYNEPRGHHYAVIDQIEIDPSRTSPGGVCLACKTPFHKEFTDKYGMDYLKAPFLEAVNMLPEKHRELGPACIDCHQGSTMEIRTHKSHLERGLALLDKTELSHQDKRNLVCAQCHITYYVPRDRHRKVADDVQPPWTGSRWGNIPIENIISDLLSDESRIEWVQGVTGFPLPYIRHPEFELYSNSSVHWQAEVSCTDCHMPYSRVGANKISDHDVTSPLKADMRACRQCHTESADWLEKQVFHIQDRTVSMLNRAGYATATAAKLFERLHREQQKGLRVEENLYQRAVDLYKRAFLRVVFIAAENSSGFHNPAEAGRVLTDAVALAGRAEALLRQMLAAGGIQLPEKIDLELAKYLNNRGERGLTFRKEQQFQDPFGNQQIFTDVP